MIPQIEVKRIEDYIEVKFDITCRDKGDEYVDYLKSLGYEQHQSRTEGDIVFISLGKNINGWNQ